MLNVFRPSCVRSVLFCLLLTAAGSTAKAQTSQPSNGPRPSARPASTSASSASASSTRTPTAPPSSTASPTAVNLSPGNTAGALVTLRYTVVSLGRLRATTATPATPTPSLPSVHSPMAASSRTQASTPSATSSTPGNNSSACTPFVSGGAGTIVFRPTPGGGLASQSRPAQPTTSRSAQKPPSSHPTSAFAHNTARSSSKHPTLKPTTSPSSSTPRPSSQASVSSCVSRSERPRAATALQSQRWP